MKKEWADKWVAALRSGKYKQGIGALRNVDDNFCCLGVLCDIVDSSKWNSKEDVGLNRTYKYNGEGGVLPQSIVNIVGMNSSDGTILLREEDVDYYDDGSKDEDEIRDYDDNIMKINVVSEYLIDMANDEDEITLVDLNDSEHFDFLKIADVIETDYASL